VKAIPHKRLTASQFLIFMISSPFHVHGNGSSRSFYPLPPRTGLRREGRLRQAGLGPAGGVSLKPDSFAAIVKY
jgi:hypothetical protein